jgi:hypothetical protein
MLKKRLKVLFDNFSKRKKYRKTLSSNSLVIREVFTNDGCSDIKNEKSGRVNAIKKAFFLLVCTMASISIIRIAPDNKLESLANEKAGTK